MCMNFSLSLQLCFCQASRTEMTIGEKSGRPLNQYVILTNPYGSQVQTPLRGRTTSGNHSQDLSALFKDCDNKTGFCTVTSSVKVSHSNNLHNEDEMLPVEAY